MQDGALQALRPDREHLVTRGFACNKGIAGIDIHRDPDRLDVPMRVRKAGDFEEVSWDTALSEIAAKLRDLSERHGPQSIASYVGNPSAFNTLARPAISSFFAQLGVRRSFGSGTQDCANKFAGSEAVFGSSTIHPIPDIEHTDVLLVFGENPRVSHASFISIPDPMKVLKRAAGRGAKIHFINPRQIESAGEGVGDVVQIRPDTDVYLLAALLCEIDRIGGFDEDVLREHGERVKELRDFVQNYPAQRVESVTGIDAERIRELAGEFSRAKAASVHMSTGVNMGRNGTLAYWLLHMLSFVTGNLDRSGGNILSVGFYRSAKAGRREFEQGFVDTEFGRLRRGALPGNLLSHYILDVEEPVRALLVVSGNPLLSIAGEERLREAFAELELPVVVDLYRNATAEVADYLLPSTDMFERADINIAGLGLQSEPFIQFTDAVVEPKAERREEWWIFARLCQEMGLKSALDRGPTPDLWGRIDHMLHDRGLTLDQVREQPHGVVLPPLTPGDFYREYLQTGTGRVDCCPPGFTEALDRVELQFIASQSKGKQDLELITRRDAYMHNTWYQNIEAMKRGDRDRNYLFMHSRDMATRGLEDGQKVRVFNEHGALEIEISCDDDLMPGVVAIVHGWGNARTPGLRVAQRTPGVNANVLLPIGPDSFEPLSSQSFMTGVPVEVAAL